jgi:DNA polymerase I
MSRNLFASQGDHPSSDRGFGPEMELFTTDGPRQADALTPDDEVLAMEPTTRLVKPKPIHSIERTQFKQPLVRISAQRAALELGADHPVPYWTDPVATVRFTTAEELTSTTSAPQYINERSRPEQPVPEKIDIPRLCNQYNVPYWIMLKGQITREDIRVTLPNGCQPRTHYWENGKARLVFDDATFTEYRDAIASFGTPRFIHGGPGARWRPSAFDPIRFCRLIGWFVTEGSVTSKSGRDTIEVSIAQRQDHHRVHIAELLERMGLEPAVSGFGMSFSSRVYGQLLGRICGDGSHRKRLPDFTWNMPRRYRRVLLDTLVAGDGSSDRRTYYTASDQLRSDVCRLAVSLGIKPRFYPNDDGWAISLSRIRDRIQRYQISRDSSVTDGYRVAVEDYPVVLTGREGKFQWVGAAVR